jgi:Icc protein
VRIAHLSDPHLTSGPLGGEPAALLSLGLRRAAALDPPPDCAVITGDLADHGRPEEYAVLREVIDDFPLPLYLAIGNHDDHDAFLDAFAGSNVLAGHRETRYVVHHPAANLIVLDSKLDASAAGRLGADQLRWLEAQLGGPGAVPTLICLHHPPVPVGIPVLDAIRLTDAVELEAALTRHVPPARILAGHVHRAVTASFAGSVVSVAPSTYRQVDLQQRPDQAAGYVHEPPGFLLHLLAETGWVTHTVPITHTSAAFGTV